MSINHFEGFEPPVAEAQPSWLPETSATGASPAIDPNALIFGSHDVASIPDLPDKLAPDKYAAVVRDAVIKVTKGGDKTGLNLTFAIVEHPIFENWAVMHWTRVPNPSADGPEKDGSYLKDNEQGIQKALGELKRTLTGLGVPQSQLGTTRPENLVGRKVWITVVPSKDSDFPRIKTLEPRSEAGLGEFTPGAVVNPYGN